MSWLVLPSDVTFFISLALVIVTVVILYCQPVSRSAIRQLSANLTAVWSFAVFFLFLIVAVLDSIHFQGSPTGGAVLKTTASHSINMSLLDIAFGGRSTPQEVTFSAPLALHAYQKTLDMKTGHMTYARLKTVSIDTPRQRLNCIVQKTALSLAIVILITFGIGGRQYRCLPLIHQWACVVILTLLISMCLLVQDFHVLGTDKVGQDIFYVTVKSIRTGMFIGLVTTLVTLPFSVGLGLLAGYKGGRVDDVIQYIYITISTIPGVLLITAGVLAMEVFINTHPQWFGSLLLQADVQLVLLCFILGLTGWTSLCRIVRAETLKLREADYIKAAQLLGSSAWRLLWHHIFPNLFHLVLISLVLDFSAAVLAEAVLSYVGVGVSPLTYSWGNMINSARLEFARDPIVWWPVIAALIPMFVLVLSANLLSDRVRDVFDPRRNSK